MVSKKVVKKRKGSEKIARSSSLNANMPKSEVKGCEFNNISATLNVPPPEYLQDADNASTELLKAGVEFHTLSVGYKARLRVLVVSIYAIALFLKHDEAAWISFTRHKNWDNAKKRHPQFEDQQDALGYAYRFAVGLTGKADSKKANKYYRALVTCFNSDDPPEEALKKIKQAGGFDRLARANAKTKTKAQKPAKPVAAVNVDPAVVRARKELQSAADCADDLKSELADAPREGLQINIMVEDDKEIALLLNAKRSDRLKITCDVGDVLGRTINTSNARVKLGKKKQKRAMS